MHNGKGENIWDRLTHERPDLIADGSNGDIACDAYSKTKEDVQLLRRLGVKFYRFSISWSRLLPTGYVNKINDDGVRYYNELIDELLLNGIEPMVTMYHWDLPQPLQEAGGWPNKLLVDFFVDYADTLYKYFGDRVRQWITFNEPIQICWAGYSGQQKAPAYSSDGIACYLCGRTLLLAHAKAYRLYDEKYRSAQNGRVGITIDTGFYAPSDGNIDEDVEAADRILTMTFGWWIHPILVGNYPDIMIERIDEMSTAQNFNSSRLPEFTEKEIELIKNTTDFVGLNHYTSYLCYGSQKYPFSVYPSFYSDIGSVCRADPSWITSASSWLKLAPWGLRGLLNWIKDKYDNPEVIITENGWSDIDGKNDCGRIEYYNSYLEEVLKAIHEDGCRVTGYTAWSFMDNFEWLQGYTERFGIVHVDFEDPNRTRTLKMSSYVYENIIRTRAIDWDYTPENFNKCEWMNKE